MLSQFPTEEFNKCEEGQTHYFEFEDSEEGLLIFHCRHCGKEIYEFDDTQSGG